MDRPGVTPALTIVIPALNEAATIAGVVEKAKAFGRVIVVDDGSTDGTGDLAAGAGAHAVRNDGPHGYENALEAGFREADLLGSAAVVTMDADGEHDPEVLARFSENLAQVPLVLGVRPRKQRVAETVMGWVIRTRFGIDDIMCGMKGYRLDLYRENGGFDHLASVGSELALNSVRRGHAFVQVPVPGRRREGRPRFGSVLRANLRIFRALWRVLTVPVR